jgi:N utilization substance protein A
MGGVVLNEKSLQLMAQFEEMTGAGSRDCIVDDQNDRLIFVINPGDMGRAIGKRGVTIKSVSDTLGKRIEVVEYSTDPEQFLKNCFLPAKVLDVDIRDEDEDDGRVAYVDIDEEDRGLAIGKAGKNIIKAKQLAMRQHDIADVKLA